MSVDAPVVALVLGSVAPPQGDVVELTVHCGCTKEVSSFEAVLQNWNSKYSPNGAYPIVVGSDGSVSVGRGANCPLLLTCRIENVKYHSTPLESYVSVSGRCWGERLFRRVITKTYTNVKGEDIVKDLLDNYVGLSHSRGGAELVEDTDTTYTALEFKDTPVKDVLQQVAESADKTGVIGYDFRVAPDGKFEFFPTGTKTNTINLSEQVEASEYVKDILRVRNRITVYGSTDKSVPSNKDAWTESLTPTGGTWVATSGTINLDGTYKAKGAWSIKTSAQNLPYASSQLILAAGNEVNADLYPTLNLWLSQEATFNGNISLTLYDTSNNSAVHEATVGSQKWFQLQIPVGTAKAESWQTSASFNWQLISRVAVTSWFNTSSSGSFWVDGLFFGGRQFSSTQNDAASQSSIGLRELVEVDEELCSDTECQSRAKALLANLKDSTETLSVQSTVLDYGATPVLAGDKIHVALPNEGVDGEFQVLSAEYYVDGKTQTLQTTLRLGREKPMLADYVYTLRSRTDRLSRYKTSRN